MKTAPIVLASASPRRRDLMRDMGLAFTIITADVDETLAPGTPPDAAVEMLARRKAEAVAPRAEGCRVVGSDTVVALDGRILGKPRDEADALSMLLSLSGKTHTVYTGVAVAAYGRTVSGVAKTEVTFRPFDEEEARAYIATGEPMDKAGAYGIQGLGGRLVSGIRGDMDTVIGLSCSLLSSLLAAAEDTEK